MTMSYPYIISIALAAAFVIGGCGRNEKPLIVAHRGASKLAPENTLSSVNLAWKLGADAVEIDVHLTSDNEIMVCHDKTTTRTTGQEHLIIETSSETLRTLDAGSWKDGMYAREKIPFLKEVIDTLPLEKDLFVEIKCGPEAVQYIKPIIDNSGKRSQIAIIGFDFDIVSECKSIMPDTRVYWLVGSKKDENSGEFLPHDMSLIQKANDSGLDGLNLHYAGITKDFTDAVKDAGLGLFAWTVNDVGEFRRLSNLHVDGITTDRPGEIRKQQ